MPARVDHIIKIDCGISVVNICKQNRAFSFCPILFLFPEKVKLRYGKVKTKMDGFCY